MRNLECYIGIKTEITMEALCAVFMSEEVLELETRKIYFKVYIESTHPKNPLSFELSELLGNAI